MHTQKDISIKILYIYTYIMHNFINESNKCWGGPPLQQAISFDKRHQSVVSKFINGPQRNREKAGVSFSLKHVVPKRGRN